jgi:uncharacterized protein (DUF433 family)
LDLAWYVHHESHRRPRFHRGSNKVAANCDPEYPATVDQPVISRDPEVMGGTPVFSGTRVPVQTLLDYLEAGESIDDFLEGFPSVRRQRVIAFLETAVDRLVASDS